MPYLSCRSISISKQSLISFSFIIFREERQDPPSLESELQAIQVRKEKKACCDHGHLRAVHRVKEESRLPRQEEPGSGDTGSKQGSSPCSPARTQWPANHGSEAAEQGRQHEDEMKIELCYIILII